MYDLSLLGAIFIIITLVGFYLAYLYGKKTKTFRWSEYWALIILPIISVVAFAYFIDSKIISLFVISALVGCTFELIVGFAYYKTLGRRLWTYQRLSIEGHTSLLSLPLWGVAGVFFWFVAKMVGL